MTPYLYAVPLLGVFALFYTWVRAGWVAKQDAGDARMTTIAGYIADGAIAFLKAEYKVLALFGLIAGAFLFYLGSTSGNSSPVIVIAFLIGGVFSALAGFIGMKIATKANVRTAQTGIGMSQANQERLQKDLKRSDLLRKQDIIPQSEYDAVQANLKATAAQRATATDQVSVARQQVAAAAQQIAVAQAVVKQRQADLDNAKLQLSYTTITAPQDGIISKKNVQPGQVVGPGQQLFGIVGSARTWVVANFKETQLEDMKVGQPVKLEVDAYPHEEFQGHIESLSAATGARFALLPPDNASGNFVKVTQRVPVKIALDKEDAQHPLRAGMSVNAVVQVK